ncbi:PepSY domain-containing protein [Vagococcus xieshaowenii]|uniref:PepSY domain-containing protein n=1 Tax=Vagococcus xieshaowenii TaxID=2562451 RepID=A0AAJ5EG54_9ENTE|nr:PepSY domain-containing protein [Vagococcus xieshaowenii]QCA29030.1 hypothetical protein E4Z98_06780 [Vagococcus xieshaowenii]TFZ40994.1 hypothetical protein E4031_06315 [Vagococcus xieshaowenii]
MTQNKNNALIGWGLLGAAAIGVVGGVLANKKYQETKNLSPEAILEIVKEHFLSEGPIEGSWINYTQEQLQKFAVTYTTYTGGITRKEGDETIQYEFIADAKTGSILDVYPL